MFTSACTQHYCVCVCSCPLQHLCNVSGEVLPSLTGSGSQVYLTSLP